MASVSLSHIWAMRIWYLVIALLIMFFHLIPLETVPRSWAPPDLLIAVTFAWALRRPDFVPAISIAAVMLLADMLFQRPPGLMALLVVLGSEYLKNQASGTGDSSFAWEWATVCLVIVMVTLLDRLALMLTLVDRAPLSLHLIQMVLTMAVYPLVVLVTQSLMGVRKLAPGDADALGGR